MPFNYQSLKNLTNASFVSASIDSPDIAGLTVTAAKIADLAVIAAKIATGAVNTTAGTVTGVLPVAKGGLATNSFAGAYRAFFSNGSAPTAGLHGIASLQAFTSSTTWNRPSGVRYIRVQLVGSGGGGSGHGESGAAGGYAERLVDISGVSTVSVTINGGGGGTYYSGAGGNSGGSCSFGPYVSASGGHGANRHNQHNGGLPGVGSGGDLNIYGGAGGGHEQRSSGMGGSSFFGGAAPAGHPQGGNFAHNHQGHAANGTGGTSGYFSGHRGSDGRPGMIVITEYF
jgi:hypothetical protein